MKITKEVLDILKNFSSINSLAYFDGSNILRTRSEDVFTEVALDSFLDKEFAVADISRVLSLLDKDYDIDIKGSNLIIKNDNYEIKYILANIDAVKDKLKSQIIIDELEIDSEVEFFLSKDNLKKLMSISSKIGNNKLKIYSKDDENINLSTYNSDSSVSDVFDLNIKCPHTHFNNEYIFTLCKINLIDASDYKINIGMRVNKKGTNIKLMKVKASYNNKITNKYIILADKR